MIEGGILSEILAAAPVFILIAVRALAMIEVAPLLSSDAIPQTAKIALAGFAAYTAIPTVRALSGGSLDPFTISFVFLIAGEAFIGIITGFYLTLIFTAFSTAGQFFSFQMGFSMMETFDPISQIENPLMGQFLNLVSMLIFMTLNGFRELFLGGFWRSIQTINVLSLVNGRSDIVSMMLSGLTKLFVDAIIISMPILGTLFLTSLATGLISKAAPQINLLQEGFPISIMTAFILIMATMPFMIEAFGRVIDSGFEVIQTLYTRIGQPIAAATGAGGRL